MNFEDLKSSEFQEKLKACETPEELVALANEEGVALTDEQIEAISGGWGDKINDRNDPTRHLAMVLDR